MVTESLGQKRKSQSNGLNIWDYIINSGSRQLSPDRNQAMLGLSTLKTKKHLHTFLSMAGLCRIWIPEIRLMVKPLYEATKAPDEELYFGMDNRKIFNDNEQALTRAPAQSSHFEKAIHLICG